MVTVKVALLVGSALRASEAPSPGNQDTLMAQLMSQTAADLS